MELVDRVIDNIIERRERILNGRINCIPSPFKRFLDDFPGVMQGYYYLVSGATKAAKTQIANYLFIFNTILYAYQNPDKAHVRIFYYPLEESQEAITLRFMSFVLYIVSNKQCRKSPQDLKSIRGDSPLDTETLELIRSPKVKSILSFFESHVEFVDRRNPTSVWIEASNYAEKHGKTYLKDYSVTDKAGNVIASGKQFDYYVPDDPDEYVIFFIDHVGLIDTENGMDLRESINKLSQYLVKIRNRYNYIPVVIQQQGLETMSLDAFKSNKIRPTVAGLSDSKYTSKDATVMLGITNPYSFEIPNYFGYDITRLKANARFLEVVVNREGESNGLLGLYFDGAVNYFEELPRPSDHVALQEFYDRAEGVKTPKKSSLFLTKMLMKRRTNG